MRFARRISASSIYIAACVSCSGVLGISAHFFDANSWVWGSFGFMVPILPMYWYYSLPSVMKLRLKMLQDFDEEGLLNNTEYNFLRKKALKWWGDRLFGPDQEDNTNER